MGHCSRFQDRAPYDFDNLRDYGVSKGSKAVHPGGNPISHSTQLGFNAPVVVSSSSEIFTDNGSEPIEFLER